MMNHSTAIELLSFAARRLIQFETRFYQEPIQRRQNVASYFGHLSKAIGSLADDLQKQRVPHDSTRELAKLANQLADFVGYELGDQETERLKQFLEQSCDTERIYREFNHDTSSPFLLDEMNKASILLQALSQGLYLPNQGLHPPLDSGFTDPIL